MTAVKPYGNVQQATILVIGHDPRLRSSLAEADYAFFLDYLERPRPKRSSEAHKYDLASTLLAYVSCLAGQAVALDNLYVTNLCSEFLPPTAGRGTVLIPGEYAAQGVAAIRAIISAGHFRVVIPLALQVAYHLARLGFFDENGDALQTFVQRAAPRAAQVAQGVYAPAARAVFLELFAHSLHHHHIPVVPVLHVRHWRRQGQAGRFEPPGDAAGYSWIGDFGANLARYESPMAEAARKIQRALSVGAGRAGIEPSEGRKANG